MSEILFKKLKPDKNEMVSETLSNFSENDEQEQPRKGASYEEWVKRKDAEKRLKRKLIKSAQEQVREELLQIAKSEKQKFEERVAAMDQWLQQKRLDEAKQVASLRDVHQREEAQRELCAESKIKSFSDWQKRQGRY